MSTSEIIIAALLSIFAICAVTGLAAKYHDTWVNSAPRTILLWFLVERRARRAARTTARGPIQTTTMNGRLIIDGQPSTPAGILLAYRLEDPYAIRLYASAEDFTCEHVFARDLLIEAVTLGHAGHGRVRIQRTSGALLGVRIDTEDANQPARTFYLPLKHVRTAVAQSLDAIPHGTEQQPGLDQTLALLLDQPQTH